MANVWQIPQAINGFELVLSLCLSISFWQYTFLITDSDVLVLLKFLPVLMKYVGPYLEDFAATAVATLTSAVYMHQKKIGSTNLAYHKYVVSIKCCKL